MSTRLGTELSLTLAFLRAGAWVRAALVAGCTALVSGLLLVVVAVAQLPAQPPEILGNLVADTGVRGGYLFSLALICVAPLTLLYQAVRLGTASREQRLAALRLAGATPADVRRLGAIEVGLPSLAGGLLGVGVYAVLRALLGGVPGDRYAGMTDFSRELRLVPTTVAPSWWQVLLVALLVGALGMLVGARASRHVVVSPLGVMRRTNSRPPRPWSLVLIVLSGPVFAVMFTVDSSVSQFVGSLFVLLVVLGVLGLGPWVAYLVGRVAQRRATSAASLLAAQRLVTDPRPAGRAGAATGSIALAAGVSGWFLTDLLGNGYAPEAAYVVPLAMVGVVLVLSLLLVAFSLGVHGVESLTDRKRSLAALAALGAQPDLLVRVQQWEAGLVALPLGALGVTLGSIPAAVAIADGVGWGLLVVPLVDAFTLGLIWVTVLAVGRFTRPSVVRACAPENLRTA